MFTSQDVGDPFAIYDIFINYHWPPKATLISLDGEKYGVDMMIYPEVNSIS